LVFRFPAELRPGVKRRGGRVGRPPNLVKRDKVDISSKLEELGKKEEAVKDGESDEEKKDGEEGDEDEEDRKVEDAEDDAEEPDEEMDGGTDYANQYFDNGEDYLDNEDDQLEEGGVF
jgi:DNA-directed RNA polymerase III subunit RPC7